MTLTRLKPIALVGVLVLILAGCATPGQGDPGVAAVFRGHTITNADVYALDQAFANLSSAPTPGADLTLLLIGPESVSIAESLGTTFTEEELTTSAVLWMAYVNVPWTRPTAESLEVIRMLKAIDFIFHNTEGLTKLVDYITSVVEEAHVNPRYGVFTVDNFAASIGSIADFIAQQGPNLTGVEFLAFQGVNGFAPDVTPEWISSGG
jgi:hypothetical protein